MAHSQRRKAVTDAPTVARESNSTHSHVWNCPSARGPRAGVVVTLIATVASAQTVVPVPRSLGEGTGGDGKWSCGSAAHSPTRIRVTDDAGPESTPAAVLEFEYVTGKYNWNWALVDLGRVDPTGSVAVRMTYRTDMPKGFPGLNVMVRESTGAGYWVPRALPPSPKRFRTETVPLGKFTVPAWSKDENGKLDVDLIRSVSLGVETGEAGKGRIVIAEVELVPEGW